MRFLIDENMSSPRLASRLQAQGHDPVLAGDVGLLSTTDARVLTWAIAQSSPVLTRDSETLKTCTTWSWPPVVIIRGCSSSASTTTHATT